jgi:4-aminobutyrate aminotransferase-like enzyme
VTTTAAKAVLDYIEEENLRVNVAEVGAYLREKLVEMQQKFPVIGEVRGMGLLQALELVSDRDKKTPSPAETVQVMEAARENGILLGKGGLYGNVLRISPPMNISKSDVDIFTSALDASFERSRTLSGAMR